MTLADLANYRAKVREPVCGGYRSVQGLRHALRRRREA